jgi:trk system potassium uptake protein TrkH
MFIGGQGIVVVALAFLLKGTPGAFKMYVGEARDEKILPNVIETARFIWVVSLTYLVLGSAALAAAAVRGGLDIGNSVFDSVCIFMAAWDTGGFAPHSQNILFFHNALFELITIVLMLLGAINFVLHYAVWNGNRGELHRNIETRTFLASIGISFVIVLIGVLNKDVYENANSLFNQGFYHLISAHTGTGYGTLYSRQFVVEWGPLSMFGLCLAMAVGGSVCSTTGAIKVLRIGILFKALRQDIKRFVISESAVLVQTFHHIREVILEDKHVRMASIILLSYVGLYIFGTVVGLFYGYSLSEALFESISASANVGLSCGITSPSMPVVLKVVYIFQMWAGRLEFISVFVLGGVALGAIKGKRL